MHRILSVCVVMPALPQLASTGSALNVPPPPTAGVARAKRPRISTGAGHRANVSLKTPAVLRLASGERCALRCLGTLGIILDVHRCRCHDHCSLTSSMILAVMPSPIFDIFVVSNHHHERSLPLSVLSWTFIIIFSICHRVLVLVEGPTAFPTCVSRFQNSKEVYHINTLFGARHLHSLNHVT